MCIYLECWRVKTKGVWKTLPRNLQLVTTILAVVLQLLGGASAQDCPDGYTYGDPYCYKVVIASVNFYDAQAACALDGGRLADPKSLDEHNDIKAVITAAGSPASAMIGLNDFVTEGTVLYMDGSALGAFTQWSGVANKGSKDCIA
ncbi:collectin-11-like [Branchiostoma floridae x Branchiostoma japonicum]